MSLTTKEWRDYSDSLSAGHKHSLMTALSVLEEDPMIKEHYSDTGIFALKSLIT